MSTKGYNVLMPGGPPLKTHIPTVITDGGPWAHHDMPCPVLGPAHSAVLDLGTGIFLPSREAERQGWRTVRFPTWLLRFWDPQNPADS